MNVSCKKLISVKVYLTITLLCFFVSLAFAQLVEVKWYKTWSGTGGSHTDDFGHAVRQTLDGGYIVAGGVNDEGLYRACLIKTDSLGNTQWMRTYGGSTSKSVELTSDSGYVVTGYTEGSEDYYAYVAKTDGQGFITWHKYCAVQGQYERGLEVQEIPSQGYFVIGNSLQVGAFLWKRDLNGDPIWLKTYGGSCSSGQMTTDGGVVIVGEYSTLVWLVKTDSLGDTLWTKTYFGGSGSSVDQTTDGGYIITGGSGDVFLIKTDSLGDTLWTRTYDGGGLETGQSVQQTSDGGYVISGETQLGGGDTDIYVIRTDSIGDTLWTFVWGDRYRERAPSIQDCSDGWPIIAGSTEINPNTWNWDILLLKLRSTAAVHEGEIKFIENDFGASILNGPLVLPAGKVCRVFNIAGQVVAPEEIKPGIYFIETDGKITRKVVKVR